MIKRAFRRFVSKLKFKLLWLFCLAYVLGMSVLFDENLKGTIDTGADD